jgi:hypothetical protein
MLKSPERLAEQLPKTKVYDRNLRAYNDTTTWFAEALNGSMRTPFEYAFDGHELYAEDGSAMGPVFKKAWEEGERLAKRQPGLQFEKRRRQHELNEYYHMLAMARGEAPNTMIVVSDFPAELMQATSDVGGYNVRRKQTMLRVVYWQNGKMHMVSQSLDGSDRQALEAMYTDLGERAEAGELLGQRLQQNLSEIDQTFLVDRLMGVYDRALAAKYGGVYRAGRAGTVKDTYAFARSQADLVNRWVAAELEGTLTDWDKYNIIAALEARFEKPPSSLSAPVAVGVVSYESIAYASMQPPVALERELRSMGDLARSAGKSFSGCGGTLKSGVGGIENELGQLGYGNKAEAGNDDAGDGLGPLTFKCTEGHTNTRKKGELLKECWVKGCRKGSVGCA